MLTFFKNILKRIFKISKKDKSYNSAEMQFYCDSLEKLRKHSLQLKRDGEVEKPLAIVTTYNDVDIIKGIVEENINQGQELIIIDNWSNDGTWEELEKLKLNREEILKLYRFPLNGPSLDYNWKELLKFKEEIAIQYPNRWIFHQDSDEVTLSPFDDIEIKYVLASIKDFGFNCVTLRMLDFAPVDDYFVQGNPVEYFKYYRYITKYSYDRQEKIWYQNNEKVNLNQNAGHELIFEGKNTYHIRFPRLHYSIRSTKQMVKKYDEDRKKRSEKERKELGWHTHIEERRSEKVVFSIDELIPFEREKLYREYLKWFIKR